MNKIIRNSLSSLILLVLSACNLFGPPSVLPSDASVVRLTVQTQNNVSTFNQAGEIINYQYVITNTGTTPLAGPAFVTDGTRLVVCPGLDTVGNLDIYLDQNETVTCAVAYSITDADVNTGSVTNVATATVGSVISNQTGLTLTRGEAPPSSTLTLAKTAGSETYGAAGQSITYTFNITNIGTTPLGPAQFTISDNKLGAPFNCGPADTTLAPNQSVTCSAPYTVTEADLNLANVTNSATASGGGQTTAPSTATITNLAAPATQTPETVETATQLPSSDLSPGSTIQHQVAVGEWLIQIVRCYGATFDEVRNANPQIANPDFILPAMIVTVPRIGSAGRIYGRPCITFHTVQGGDTWASIAQRYNADLAVLQKVNPVTLTAGTSIKIP
ncbi:MAG TPA: LysM peptidoglycan-binding domain-containing protein, partial [Anaerolineales bacterium]|nr:LysM peptidoglycan-binding domain-containing protein [Anaerolineales bacterium]